MKSEFPLLLAASIFLVSAGARADTVDQDGILRGDHGKVLEMNQAEAIVACAKHGMHLPIIRELVKLSRSAGLALKELDERIGAMEPISAVNPSGQFERFYYSNENYTRPSGELGINWFWSSSCDLFNSNHGYALNGNVGVVHIGARVNKAAVRCSAGSEI